MAEPPNPHDRFFRHVFARPEVAQGFFERYLPTDVSALLDLNTLTLAKESFVDAALKVQQSDFLFRLKTRARLPALLYLLLEHKSYPDPWVGLQLLGYLVQIWKQEKQRLTAPPLPPIVPLVVYHGERSWQIAAAFRTLIEAPEPLARYTPAFDFRHGSYPVNTLSPFRRSIWRNLMAVDLPCDRSLKHRVDHQRCSKLALRIPPLVA